MNSRATCFTLLAGIAISLFSGPLAQAQQRARVFVSVNGNDSNPCTGLSPCKTFQHAHDAVLAGGEISVLDTGGYGTLTITKALSIVAVGVEASIAIPSGGTGITINAGASDAINLRGLTIDGTGVGQTGIALLNAQSLVIENCVVRNLTASGIALAPSSDTVTSNITVSNTIVADNGGNGVYVQPAVGFVTVNAVFNRVQALRNAQRGIGIFSNTSPPSFINAIAVDSVAAYNETGFYALGSSGAGGASQFRVFRSTTFSNGNIFGQGMVAEGGGLIQVSQSNLESDGWGVATGGKVFSYGDNYTSSTPVPTGTLGKN